jgi:hypothetical protein
MAQQNRFLQEFINMRKKLHESPGVPTLRDGRPQPALTIHQASQSGLTGAGTTSLVSNKRQSHTQVAQEPVMDDTITYKRIVDDKPPKADVIEYLRGRIEDIVAAAD